MSPVYWDCWLNLVGLNSWLSLDWWDCSLHLVDWNCLLKLVDWDCCNWLSPVTSNRWLWVRPVDWERWLSLVRSYCWLNFVIRDCSVIPVGWDCWLHTIDRESSVGFGRLFSAVGWANWLEFTIKLIQRRMLAKLH